MWFRFLINLALRIGPAMVNILRVYGPVLNRWRRDNNISLQKVMKTLESIGFAGQNTYGWHNGMRARLQVIHEQIDALKELMEEEPVQKQLYRWEEEIDKLQLEARQADNYQSFVVRYRERKAVEKKLDALIAQMMEIYIQRLDQDDSGQIPS